MADITDNKPKEIHCAFCGRQLGDNEETFMIQGPMQEFLCTECAENVYKEYQEQVNILKNENKLTANEEQPQKKQISPKKIKELLDNYVIKQDDAKKVLSTAIYNHMLINSMKKKGIPGADEIEKSNVIMAGPTGVGKTAMLKRLAKELGIPFVIEDITSFSSTGYVGRDIQTMLNDLYEAADRNLEKAEQGIIYIDEIDKTSRKGENMSTTADPTHEQLQQTLLKFVEGGKVAVNKDRAQRQHPEAATFDFDTSNVLFIVGGAFEGIEKIISNRLKKHTSAVGIGSKLMLSNNTESYNELIDQLRVEDFKKFGMIPELLGRFPTVCHLNMLDEEDLVRILVEPKNSLVKQYKTMFTEGYKCNLDFSETALRQIAKKALARGTGARALRGVMEEVMGEVMFNAPKTLSDVYVDFENDDFQFTTTNYEKICC